jgi:cell division septation protein DedD
MKSTTDNIDKEPASWSLSWNPEGRCDSFTKEAILAHAPEASGVYGLFNFDCQIFIGESENIQQALLRLECETDFQSQHLRPTGFTFETCAAELRKPKADELIAKFQPVLQTQATLTETRPPINEPLAKDVSVGGENSETHADHLEFPVHDTEKRPKAGRRFHVTRARAAVWATMFVASAAVIFIYFGTPTKKIYLQAAAGEKAPAQVAMTQPPAPAQVGTASRSSGASRINTHARVVNGSPTPAPIAAKPQAPAPSSNGAVRLAAKDASAADESSARRLLVPAKKSLVVHSEERADSNKKWSVQIAAAPAKNAADDMIQRLKAQGYDGYVVQAEVKGQTYYRVRVGRFGAREQAESVRQSLAHQEGYKDAFLTGD